MGMYLILLIIKKYKTEITFAFILKEIYFIFKVKEFSFYFDLKRELDSNSFSVLATKLFHITGPRIDIRNLLLRSLVFGLL